MNILDKFHVPSEDVVNRIIRIAGFLFFVASTLFTMGRWAATVDQKLDTLADNIEERRKDDSFHYQELQIKNDALHESINHVEGTAEELKACKEATEKQGRRITNLGNAVDWLSGRVKHLEEVVKEQGRER